MFTRTTIVAVRLLIRIGSDRGAGPASLRQTAEQLEESPSYLAKIARQLVRAGILRALRGVSGGVVLGREPAEISLLAVVEACQGQILGDFCQATDDLRQTCAFHQASAELHQATIKILLSWTLSDLLRRPAPTCSRAGKAPCWIQARHGLLLAGSRRTRTG